MKKLSTIAQRLADEIRAQDWSDAHSRADGARHNRGWDHTTAPQLSDDETEVVRMNVIWVVGQALAEDDPNFDIRAFAQEAGAASRFMWTSSGKPSGAISAGIRPTAARQRLAR